ncbi:serine hydrolase [Nonlabens xiamenensis]|uniref:serine hydrolase n=1 Tax=Nonlabens xiamenensis TaxID=2341043 RepID=UPI000F607D64|nr:serine hydrolase [Nonlabens xiamenensis]
MLNKLVLFLTILSVSWAVASDNTLTPDNEATELPHAEVVNYQDAGLQLALQDQINANPHWNRLIRQKRMSISLVDMSEVGATKYANINGDHMMYAASMPKIAVLYAAMDAIEEGDLRLTKEIEKDMWLMISKSNNAASTRMIDRVGFQRIEDLMCNPENPFYDKNGIGGLWVGKRYAAGGKRNPEPIRGLSHAATTDAVAKFYYQLATGQLINEKRSKQMLRYMKNPGLHHKFVNTLDKIAPNATLFRKSGSWKNWHCDSIMVWDEKRGKNYILVAMVEDPDGENIIRNLVKPAELALDQRATLVPEINEDEILITADS